MQEKYVQNADGGEVMKFPRLKLYPQGLQLIPGHGVGVGCDA